MWRVIDIIRCHCWCNKNYILYIESISVYCFVQIVGRWACSRRYYHKYKYSYQLEISTDVVDFYKGRTITNHPYSCYLLWTTINCFVDRCAKQQKKNPFRVERDFCV